MGDTVQYHLERMVPELEDLEKRGLFSRSEIKEIVRRRRDFEYLLKRPSPLKQDFLRYIEYEKQLEALRKLKKKALIKNMSQSGEQWRNSLCDRSCAMRIMLIYERAVTRFKGDLNLWLQYIEFCKSHGSKRMQRVMTKALKLHSTVPGLWIYAAVWEFEHNLNVTAARALMQRGLRMCPTSENLWLEYFRMELTYVQKLRSRKLLLGLDGGGGNPVENSMTMMLDSQEQEYTNDGTAHKISSDTLESESKLSQNIASAVYRNAVAAIPSSARLRQNFLELLDSVDSEHTHVLEETICESLAQDFPTDEDCWDWQARRLFEKSMKQVQDNKVNVQEALRQTCQVYENALQTLASTSMYERFSIFLEELLSFNMVNCKYVKLLEGNDENLEMVVKKLVQLYEQAEKAGLASAFLAEKHIGLLLRWGKLENATDLATLLCSSSMQTCGRIWALRLTLKTKSSLDSEKEKIAVLELFQEALLQVPIIQAKPIWKLGRLWNILPATTLQLRNSYVC
ncbi:hypothetical protein O6H91_08G107700 [Diphasiastrum complanatum]|uniref:Uncharacterized protein n=1 Tax=Diphasiastrum complanatum TaxID=34168 RepID=A0ACC2D0M7_DIPCM|nr:hypothetical protein O6H91_Y253200 [Diphasiastrum complanatum]KAJ7547875.1 hypothetical protein O6H91_08G107700 [Diphasiastrum complanatum]